LDTTSIEFDSFTDRREAWLLGVAFAFLLLTTLALLVAPAVREGSWQALASSPRPLLVLPVWAASAIALHRQLSIWHPNRDPFLLPIGLLLAGWGALLVVRLSPTYGLRQIAWLAVGSLLAWIVLRLPADMRWLRRYRYIWLTGGLALTALTLLAGTNPSGGEERLWLGCCGVYLQPSEPLRLLLLAYLASFLADRLSFGWVARRTELRSALLPLFLVWGISVGILLVQRDLGTGTLLLGLLAVMLYLAVDRWQVLLAAIILAMVGAAAAYLLFDVVRLRILAWLNPWADPMGGSYQVIQGLIAYASGGLFGRGPGIGAPGLVPIAVSDYIFAAVGEEWGLTGGMALITLYALLVQRGLRAARRSADPFRALLAGGIAAAFGLQALMILGGVLRLLPLTGITLPFLSYGGSSLITSMVGLALLITLSAGGPVNRLDRPTRVVQAALTLGWVALALALGWWTVVRGPALTTRTDNPRRALAERVNPRGAIVDRNGVALAETIGAQGDYARSYPLGTAAAAVVGYDSARFAQAGVERSRDETLRGETGHDAITTWWQHLTRGTPPPGLGIRLTLDAALQASVAQALAPYRGAAVVLEVSSGNVLALASSPSFDPNMLDQDWEELTARADAPLLNRTTQAFYQPGMIFAPFLLAQGVESGLLSLDDAAESLDATVEVGSDLVGCALEPVMVEGESGPVLADALRYGCPEPLTSIAARDGGEVVQAAAIRFALGEVPLPEVDLTGVTGSTAVLSQGNAAMDAIGQGEWGLSPLQVARAFAALRSGGTLPEVRLVDASQAPQGEWTKIAALSGEGGVITPSTAALILETLKREPDGYYGVGASAVTGTGGRRLNWFAGATPEGQPGVVVVVALENGTQGDAWRIGRAALLALGP
jgi:cell division protein FtsW (lipid II flippase)/cell division protein FtsI/penicillin-binding protein 2